MWFIIHGLSEHLGPKGQVSHGLCFSPLTLPKKDTGGIVLQQPELSDSLDSSLNAWRRDRMPLSKTTIFGSAASRASSQSFRAWAKPRQGKTWKNYANSSLPSKDVSMSTYRQPPILARNLVPASQHCKCRYPGRIKYSFGCFSMLQSFAPGGDTKSS